MKISKKDALTWFSFFAQLPEEEPLLVRQQEIAYAVMAQIEAAVEQVFDLRPAAIIEALGLKKPIYRALAAYGHMGREDLGVAWENTDKAAALKAALARA